MAAAAAAVVESNRHDLQSPLFSPTRDFLVRNKGDQVYFSASWRGPCRRFSPQLIEAEIEEIAKGWPEKMKHALHEKHELVLSRRKNYVCGACEEPGAGWSFYCKECDFDLHPKCALDGAKDGDF